MATKVTANVPGNKRCKLKIVGSGATQRVYLDGKEFPGITSLTLDLDAACIPTVDMLVYALDVNSETDAEVHLTHAKILAQAIAEECDGISAMTAMEIAQKVLYRIAERKN